MEIYMYMFNPLILSMVQCDQIFTLENSKNILKILFYSFQSNLQVKCSFLPLHRVNDINFLGKNVHLILTYLT